MNIRSSILFAVALLILPLTAAQAHEFTLPDGRTVTGSVTAVGNGQVTIRTSDSRELHLPIASLAPADLDHARQWWNENRKYWFIINAEAKMQSGAAAKASEGMLKVTKRDWAYTVTVRNNTAYATPELQAEYAVFMSKPGQNVATPAITKPLRIPALNPGASYQFQTDAVDISTYRPPDGYYFTNGHGQRHRDQLGGLTLKLATAGKNIWAHESVPGLLGTNLSLAPGLSVRVSDNRSSRAYSGPPAGLASSLLSGGSGRVTFSSPAP